MVIVIKPLLINRYVDLSCRMGIGQSSDGTVLRISAEGISSRQICFIPCVVNQLPIIILRQVSNRRSPVVRRGQRNSSNFGRTVHQVNSQAVRTDTILVVRVGPFLGNRNESFFLGIGNSHFTSTVSTVGIARSADRGSFYYIIGKRVDITVSVVLMLRQVIPLVLPVIGLAQPLGINYRVFLVADNARNRLQSTLHRAHFFSRCEADVAATVGSNEEVMIKC